MEMVVVAMATAVVGGAVVTLVSLEMVIVDVSLDAASPVTLAGWLSLSLSLLLCRDLSSPEGNLWVRLPRPLPGLT